MTSVVPKHAAADGDAGDPGNDRGAVLDVDSGHLRIPGIAEEAVGGIDPGGDVAGDPIAADADGAGLGVGIVHGEIGVVAEGDVRPLDATADGEAAERKVGRGGGRGLTAGDDPDVVA